MYSSVASKESTCLAFLLSEMNGIDMVTINITNAYMNMPCQGKVAAVVGPEFGKYEGYIVIIEKTLCGLKSSGAVWHAHLSEKL